jgi:hypothetical protein
MARGRKSALSLTLSPRLDAVGEPVLRAILADGALRQMDPEWRLHYLGYLEVKDR